MIILINSEILKAFFKNLVFDYTNYKWWEMNLALFAICKVSALDICDKCFNYHVVHSFKEGTQRSMINKIVYIIVDSCRYKMVDCMSMCNAHFWSYDLTYCGERYG